MMLEKDEKMKNGLIFQLQSPKLNFAPKITNITLMHNPNRNSIKFYKSLKKNELKILFKKKEKDKQK